LLKVAGESGDVRAERFTGDNISYRLSEALQSVTPRPCEAAPDESESVGAADPNNVRFLAAA
jgi:hypothetical protein